MARSDYSLPRQNRDCFRCTDDPVSRWCWGCVPCIIVCVILGVTISSFKSLDSTEFGLKYNVHKKQLDPIVKVGGLYSGTPGFQFVKFPSTQINRDTAGTCNSMDGLKVEYQVSFQYLIEKEWILPVIQKYRDYDHWTTIVEAAGQSAIQHSCSYFEISKFQSQRGLIQETMEQNVRLKLHGSEGDGRSGIYAKTISLQLRNVKIPLKYKKAVESKQQAAEDIELAIRQRSQEVTKAQTKLLAANEQAHQILDTAYNDANVTLTEANLKAEEIVYQINKETQVLLEVKRAFNFTTEGLLSFQANQMYHKASNIHVTSREPASLSFISDL